MSRRVNRRAEGSVMATKLPGLKNIPPKTDRELKIALDAIKEALEVRLGRRGDPLDRAVTLRELSDSGIVKVRNSARLKRCNYCSY